MTRHWTINGRFLCQPVTGVQRYAREIVLALDAQVAQHGAGLSLEILAHPSADPGFALAHIPVRRAGPGRGHAWEQLVLPALARGRLVNLCNTGPVAARGQVVCIHDLNTRAYPQSYGRAFRALYDTLLPVLARRAAAVTTVSAFSASEIVRHGLAPPERVSVLPNGHEHVARWQPEHNAETRAASGPDTIVLLGSPAAHKNVGLVLGLAPRLAEAGLRIAVVGRRDASVFAGGQLPPDAPNVVWLGRQPDTALAALLADCLCLAFPSLTEGFGLPPLEALALGCPVVSSDRASLPEVGRGAALLVDPERPEAWFDHFVRLRHDPALRADMIRRGHARAARFSWAASAAGYLDLMARLDGAPARGQGGYNVFAKKL